MNKVYLLILDGFGLADPGKGNAVTLAHTPYLDQLLPAEKISKLKAHGHSVGLPEFQMGGSEVGHVTIGAGRPVKHILTKINDEIEAGTFFEKENLKALFTKAQKKGRIHFLGLASDGGIHSFLPHLFGLSQMAEKFDIPEVYVHSFLDGRDVPERTAKTYLEEIEKHNVGTMASIGGRFFGMDRDTNWDRTKKEYDVLTDESYEATDKSWEDLIDEFYEADTKSDYYLPPQLLCKKGQIEADDVVICFNFRTDRMRQIMAAFCDDNFDSFERPFICDPQNFGIFGNYYDRANIIFSLSSEPINNTLGQLVCDNGGTQLRVAETDKVNHVTFFFSGEKKTLFEGEERILVDSPKVASYAEAPEMSAAEHTTKTLAKLAHQDFNLVVHNYANGDLVGHSADIPATITAVETLDRELKRLIPVVQSKGYDIIITADHGNCEQMFMGDGHTPCPTHSKNLVPFRLIKNDGSEPILNQAGTLADVAPTICELLEIEKPEEMSGGSLIA
jgi:2,3-bisphosphoglycerate-independent phosphoglycerate mutase